MAIRAILFDLGNTLLEYGMQGKWREFGLQRVREMYPLVSDLAGDIQTDQDEFSDLIGEIIVGIRSRRVEVDGHSWHFAERLRYGLKAVDINASKEMLDRLTDFFYEPIRACTRPYPDTARALYRLKLAGLKLAVITNAPWDTPTRLLRGDLERWNFAGFINAFVCSGEVPWRKPNPKFMLAAAEELHTEADACIVVGDNVSADIAGANAAGMRSIWMNRDETALPDNGAKPTWEATSLLEVVEIIGKEI